jgi:hypothetical protein
MASILDLFSLATPSGIGSYICLLLVIVISYISYHRYFHPLAGIPGPFLASTTRLWLVYHARQFKRHTLEQSLHQKYGSVVRISPNEIMVSDPGFVRTVYGATSSFNKGRWYEAVAPEDRDGMNLLGESDMKKYRFQKRMIRPVLSTQAVQAREHLLSDTLRKFVAKMSMLEEQPIDISKWMNILAIDLLTQISFSTCKNLIEAGDDEKNIRDIDNFWKQINWIGLVPGFRRSYFYIRRVLLSMGVDILPKADTRNLSIVQVHLNPLLVLRSSLTTF